ncbi:MAG: DUF1501 domain-containing protein [Planctomycetota bacterium]|nr:DUF1501 domain-containing protein [Planctomycetota bacterium]
MTMSNRRNFIRSSLGGSLLYSGIAKDLLARQEADALAPRGAHFPGKAKKVIFVFFSGGVSHVDSFDPKPALYRDHGKQLSLDHPETRGRGGYEKLFLKIPNWTFKPRGKSGIEVSDLFPHIGAQIDQCSLIRSMHTSHSNHFNATLGMHTGSFAFSRPSIGSWVSYGLGTENSNLPSFMVLAPQMPYAGTQVWASDFLPGAHQGTRVQGGDTPIANIKPSLSIDQQRREIDALTAIDALHGAGRSDAPFLAARTRSFRTAFGMESALPEAMDLTQESAETKQLYGIERPEARTFGQLCLTARRLVERGVRFVELIHTGSSFNNTAENPGREHHNWAFSSFLAGAGVRKGYVHGNSDEYGVRAVEKPVHVHDFHATILHLMGFDHEKLTYRHAGRDYRLTDIAGNVVRDVLA